MLVEIFVMQCFCPQFRRLFVVLVIVVSVVFVFNWDRVSTSTVYNSRVNSNLSTSDDRTIAWEHGLEFWSAKPLLGRGMGQYGRLARAAGYEHDDIESEYFDILVSAGLAGFLPYIGLLFMMAYDALSHYRGQVRGSLAEQDLIVVFWAILAGYMIATSTEITVHLIVPTLLFSLAGAIIYSRGSEADGLSCGVSLSRGLRID